MSYAEEKYGLAGSGKISKIDEENRHVFGWSYITHTPDGELNIDKSGDFVDDHEELEKAAYDFVLRSRNGGEDHRRAEDGSTPIVKSTMIESIVFTPEKCEKLGIPPGTIPYGWWVGFAINDEDTWGRVKKGELTSFSIHGKGTRKSV